LEDGVTVSGATWDNNVTVGENKRRKKRTTAGNIINGRIKLWAFLVMVVHGVVKSTSDKGTKKENFQGTSDLTPTR
jgi:hypothetical protein